MIALLSEIRFPGWDPVALHLGPLQVRWYGLGYLAGFLVAGFVLDRLVKDGYLPLTKEKVSDFIGWLVLSVILGGRLGYALFYEQRLLTHPLELVRIWEGGLSFHGGLAGVAVGSLWFARRQRVPWLRLGDGLALAIPFGILFVRCANFINGELYGRIASAAVPWAMRFPTDPAARALSPELARGGGLNWHDAFERLAASGQWDVIAGSVPLRHPSQLYEALLEGLQKRFADVPDATLRRKQARQAARAILPNATETRIVVTGNYRAWRHFVAMRATEHADVAIERGERVLVLGESGTGKSTLVRAIAGLWPWGHGRILMPQGRKLFLMPQRPYIPLGSLRRVATYPLSAREVADASLRELMELVGLGYLTSRLDETAPWDHVLSGGEKQRVGFVRLLLHRPDIIVMDEATSALDPQSQERMMSLVMERLPEAAVVTMRRVRSCSDRSGAK